MPLEPVPAPIADPALPLPSLADRESYGPRRRAWLAWEHQQLTPGMQAFAANAYANAFFAAQMATQAASTAGFLGEWGDQTGAAAMPASVLHENVFYVLMQDVADITAHEPGVSIVWASFEDSSDAEGTLFDDTIAALGAPNVQLAIEALVTRVNNRVSRTGATGSAVMPVGTTAQRDLSPLLAYKRFNISLNEGRGAWETWNGITWEQEGWVYLGTVATTSGTEADLNSVPAWINEIELSLRGVGTADDAIGLFRLGTAVGFDTTDYVSAGDGSTAVSGFRISGMTSSNTFVGCVRLRRGMGNTWDFSMEGSTTGGNNRNNHGYKTLSGPLTRVRFTTTGSIALNAGSIACRGRK